jgi:TRAP-type C4-dicarboxylate transport system permease large subunit
VPALALPFVIRAAVVEGVATATEVSTIGIAYALLGRACWSTASSTGAAGPMLVETAALSGAILLIIGTATGDGLGADAIGLLARLASTMAGLPGRRAGFLAVSIVAFVVLGSVLEGIPAIVLFGPLLFPIARAGRHPRGALRDGRDPGHGHRPVRAAVRRRLLRGLRDRPPRGFCAGVDRAIRSSSEWR